MKTPEEKYLNDPSYKMLVDTLLHQIIQAHFTPSEIREAAVYAAIRYEQIRIKPRHIFTENSITPREARGWDKEL